MPVLSYHSGVESESWRNLREEVIGRFVARTYQGAPMAEQLKRFYTVLGDEPGWEK